MRIIKKVFRRGILLNSFLDDFIVWASTEAEAISHLDWTKKVLIWLGFKINEKKTSEHPVQSLVYLGVILDLKSLTLSLPQDKIAKLRGLCNATVAKQKISRAELEGLIGLITFSYSVIPLGRMYATPLMVWMNEHTSANVRLAMTYVLPLCESYWSLSAKATFFRKRSPSRP